TTQKDIPHMAPHLSLLLAGAYGVSTVSKVSVKTGNYITIPCRYDQRYIQYVKYWCQGDYWNSCSALVRTDQPKISGTKVFTVIMTDLEPDDSNIYRCVVEINGGTDSMIQLLYLSVTPGSDSPKIPAFTNYMTGVLVSFPCNKFLVWYLVLPLLFKLTCGMSKSTVGAIIRKWKTYKTTDNLPRSGLHARFPLVGSKLSQER
uniref:Ig-like domain-containing protein n=1 Tax=Oncorhynchus mykiss TaxID=8022 RepID=A0A8C7ULI1_ONCMY